MKWVRASFPSPRGGGVLGARQPPRRLPGPREAPRSFSGFWQNGAAPTTCRERSPSPACATRSASSGTTAACPTSSPRTITTLPGQGYVAAALRLWQMDFQSLYTAGRIAEIIGPPGVRQDIFSRRFGLPWARRECSPSSATTRRRGRSSRRSRPALTPASATSAARPAGRVQDPDYRPEPWTDLKCVLLLRRWPTLGL